MIKQAFYIFFVLCFFSILVSSCGKSAADYAQQFCDCSADLAHANLRYKNGLINEDEFSKISQTHLACMGEDNPLKALENEPEKQKEFKIEFIKALEKNCPNIARDMGY